jgi:hypothetical protein
MKKVLFVVIATGVAMTQFGCSWKIAHDVAAHVWAGWVTLGLL